MLAVAGRQALIAAPAARSILLRVLSPQLIDELRADKIGAVHGDQPQYHAAVLLQVPEHKVLTYELP